MIHAPCNFKNNGGMENMFLIKKWTEMKYIYI